MKRVFHLLDYLFSLGVFGLLLFLNVLVLGWTIYNGVMLNFSSIEVNDSISLRQAYADLEYNLLDQSLYEKYYVLTGDETTLPLHAEVVQRFWDSLDWAAENLGFATEEIDQQEYSDDSEVYFLQMLSQTEEDYLAGFAEVTAAIQSGDIEEAIRLSDEVTTVQIEDMRQRILEAFARATMRLEQAKTLHRSRLHNAVFSGILSLLLLPLLAIWAFLRSSQINHPLLSLTNAVIAMKNGMYREKLLENLLPQGGWPGDAAQALHRLAQEQQQREQELTEKIDALQTRLNEVRRRRLMVGALKRNVSHDETV